MLTQLDTIPATETSTSSITNRLLQEQANAGPFVKWHLRRKFVLMDDLFRRYLAPGAKLVDIGCGKGDALVLASFCVPGCEEWGIDIDRRDLDIARRRVASAILYEDDMHAPRSLPREYFDVVHEFGAAFLSHSWHTLASVYLSLLKNDGILLWELPQRWSLAHIAYLLTPAPKRTPDEPKFRRLMRSVLPSKYRFESDTSLTSALDNSGSGYEIVERISLGTFYFPALLHWMLDLGWNYFGDGLFEGLDKATRSLWPRDIGYYLVIRKKNPQTQAA